MENTTFDQFVSRFHTGASRRGILGGMAGAVIAGLTGAAEEADAKKTAHKRRRRPGSDSNGSAKDFVTICHITSGSQGAKQLQVARRALRSHLAHGDFQHVDCCVNADCDAGPCFSAQCVSGKCSVTQLPQGTPCDLEGLVGGNGGCTATGMCVPAATAGG